MNSYIVGTLVCRMSFEDGIKAILQVIRRNKVQYTEAVMPLLVSIMALLEEITKVFALTEYYGKD